MSEKPFRLAADEWLDTHQLYISEKSRKCYQQCIYNLTRFWGRETPLRMIGPAAIVEYQRKRSQDIVINSQPPRKVGPRMINYECLTLASVLKANDIIIKWKALRLKPAGTSGRALEMEQEEKLFTAAQENKRWYAVYLAGLISNNTTAGTSEVQRLRIQDVNLKHRELHITESIKNGFRPRIIYLNDVAFWAAEKALERAESLGANRPDHYLFPANSKSRGKHAVVTHDPAKPQMSWRRAWRSLTEAAGLPGLRYYDLRHNPITKLYEDPQVSDETVEKIAGHRGIKKIKEHYSHIRKKVQREAVERLAASGYKPSGVRSVQNTSETA